MPRYISAIPSVLNRRKIIIALSNYGDPYNYCSTECPYMTIKRSSLASISYLYCLLSLEELKRTSNHTHIIRSSICKSLLNQSIVSENEK